MTSHAACGIVFNFSTIISTYLGYLQTAKDGRPRPKEIIWNAKVKENREAHMRTQSNTNRKHGRG